MITRIKSDRIIKENSLFNGYIYLKDDKIFDLTTEDLIYDIEYDYTGYYVSPGFIDIHTHGANNHGFVNCTKEDVILGSNYHLSHGTTSIIPTISAAPFKVMEEATKAINDAIFTKESLCNILGAHLEGPYLSKEQCGAQCPDFITPPKRLEYESLIKKYPGIIKRWTYAPENDENGDFSKYLKENGIIASIGHSNAKGNDCKQAFDNGVKLVTHLYSCTSTITRDHGFRNLGVIESCYLNDDCYAEIIADGKHLPIDLIKLILKIKGIDKVILTTDSLSVTGSNILSGEMSGTKFIIEDGVCKLLDRSAFAGSIATTDRLVRILYKDVNVSIIDVVKMITKNPAELFNLNKGLLKAGYDADINIFDDDINIISTFVLGKKIK